MTEGLPAKVTRRIILRASMLALVVIMLFAFFGSHIFNMFGISVDGLKVVGGIIFFILGYDLLQAKVGRTKITPQEDDEFDSSEFEHVEDMAWTPLGIPLLCGPASMTNAMILMEQTDSAQKTLGFVSGTIAIMTFSAICLLASSRITKLIGPAGHKVVLRLMGLLIMVIAVETLSSGIKGLFLIG